MKYNSGFKIFGYTASESAFNSDQSDKFFIFIITPMI